jgi:hypothetical protein
MVMDALPPMAREARHEITLLRGIQTNDEVRGKRQEPVMDQLDKMATQNLDTIIGHMVRYHRCEKTLLLHQEA